MLAAARADPTVRVIFLCSPNNPTGNDLALADVAAVIEGCPDRIVVVDEAYLDFSTHTSTATWVRQYPNLVVLQTLSKSFGLAGIRLGMAFASPDIVDVYNRVKAPYSINQLTAAVGPWDLGVGCDQHARPPADRARSRTGGAGPGHHAAMEAFTESGLATMRAHVDRRVAEREWVRAEVDRIPGVVQTWPSASNFFCVRVPDAFRVYKAMADAGVVVRFRGHELFLDGVLRVSVGTRAENEALVKTLTRVLAA